MMGRFGGADFGGNEFDQEGGEGSMMNPGNQQKITVNLEDAVLEEQKLFQILEVRVLILKFEQFLSLTLN